MNTTLAQPPGQSSAQSPGQPLAAPRTLLARSDLIRFEHIITGMLERFFTFKAHSIYFPRESAAPEEPRWLGGERKVLVPLRLGGQVLGVFAGRGARLPRGLFPMLGSIADLCMENLALHKSNLTDSLTGLFTRDYLLDSLSGAIAQQRLRFTPLAEAAPGTPDMAAAPGGFEARNFAVLTVQLRGLQRLAADYGYLFLEKALARLAAEFAALAPEGALAARISDGELGLYLPEGTPKACRALGREIIARLAGLTFSHELSGSTVSIRAAAGYACFPQQAELPKAAHGAAAPDFPLDLDQARRILRKSRLAAYLAATEFSAASEGKIQGFEQILSSGGRIREILPYGRARVNLGRDVGARVGQCFAIWGADPAQAGFDPLQADSTALAAAAYAGEMVLVAVDQHEATAELFHQADPARPVQRGDYLTLLPEGAFQYGAAARQTGLNQAAANQSGALGPESPETVSLPAESASPQVEPDFLDFHTFTERLAMAGDSQAPCALALLRLDILNWPQDHDQPLNLGEITAQAAARRSGVRRATG